MKPEPNIEQIVRGLVVEAVRSEVRKVAPYPTPSPEIGV